VDLGPERATPAAISSRKASRSRSRTARNLSPPLSFRELKIPFPIRVAPANGKAIQVLGATANNLKDVDVTIPSACSPSSPAFPGPGNPRSSTTFSIARSRQKLYRSSEPSAQHREITGIEFIDKVIEIDQAPIGRTPRSNPATYTWRFRYGGGRSPWQLRSDLLG